MYRIALCKKDRNVRNMVKEYILEYAAQKNIICDIDMYTSVKEFLDLGIRITKYNIVFIQISEEADSVQVAKKIRTVNNHIYVVFAVDRMDCVTKRFIADGIQYMVEDKLTLRDSVFNYMDTMIERKGRIMSTKEISIKISNKSLPLSKIIYIKSRLHKLEFMVMGSELKSYSIYEKMDVMEELLTEKGFLRIHQSFLVNMKYVKVIINYKAILVNGIELPVPSSRFSKTKRLFIVYQNDSIDSI